VGVIVRLKMKIRIRDRSARAIREPEVPRCRRIERAGRHQHKRVTRCAIGLAARELFFNDRRDIGTSGNADADTFLRLSTTAHGTFDLRAPRMSAIQSRTIRVCGWNRLC
jgi:hypothetical protein